MTFNPTFETIPTNGIKLRAAVVGAGPLIILVHGWPESWYSWRHQMTPLADAGYKVVALDVRGYGGSDKPPQIEAYAMSQLIKDVLGVIDYYGQEQAILVGHDWGAPIVWNTACLHPDRIRAVAALSVPWLPAGKMSAIDLWRMLYQGKFFYQKYFQEPGVAEAEMNADIRRSLRMVYFNLSGNAPENIWIQDKPEDARLFDGLIDPDPLPEWISKTDLDYYSKEFEAHGFGTALHRYRCQTLDWEQLPALRDARIKPPACFLAGTREIVLSFAPDLDLIGNMRALTDDLRLCRMIDGAGHWLQQERPEQVTAALLEFFATL